MSCERTRRKTLSTFRMPGEGCQRPPDPDAYHRVSFEPGVAQWPGCSRIGTLYNANLTCKSPSERVSRRKASFCGQIGIDRARDVALPHPKVAEFKRRSVVRWVQGNDFGEKPFRFVRSTVSKSVPGLNSSALGWEPRQLEGPVIHYQVASASFWLGMAKCLKVVQ